MISTIFALEALQEEELLPEKVSDGNLQIQEVFDCCNRVADPVVGKVL
jgi:hypothetical protein